jgi:hypothetical protein
MMNKTLKIIVSGILLIVIYYLAHFFYGIAVYSHDIDWVTTGKKYTWIFQDSIKNNIDTDMYSYVKKRDIYTNFHYKGIYNIIIWEFKDLSTTELKNIAIKKNVNLENIKIRSGEIFNKNSDLEISVKYCFDFKNTLNLNLDNYSTIEKTLKGSNYTGFYGTINKMSFNDGKGDLQILLDYAQGRSQTVFLLYKGHYSFYIILINPINRQKPFDENIIKILNLS